MRGQHSEMGRSSHSHPETSAKQGPRRLAVSLGVALFVAGFATTVATISRSAESVGDGTMLSLDAASSGQHLLLALGVLTSIAGVVVATAVPLAMAVKSRQRT